MSADTTELVARLGELMERATPGPWEATERSGYHELLAPDLDCDWYGRKGMHAVAYCDIEIDEDEQQANAALIVAAVNALPTLLSERATQATRLRAVEEALEPFAKMGALLDGKFAAVLFPDEMPVEMAEGQWSENGEPRAFTFGDLRRACTVLGETP